MCLVGFKSWADSKECLALAIYYESRSESMLGQVAVGQVVLNRVKSKHFPNTACDVVYQARTYKNGKKWIKISKNEHIKHTYIYRNRLYRILHIALLLGFSNAC